VNIRPPAARVIPRDAGIPPNTATPIKYRLFQNDLKEILVKKNSSEAAPSRLKITPTTIFLSSRLEKLEYPPPSIVGGMGDSQLNRRPLINSGRHYKNFWNYPKETIC
jgi:hypothetical protein